MNKKSFTLLELLVAGSIFSLIIVGVYSAFRAGVTGYGKLDADFQARQNCRIVLNRMEIDLRNAFNYSGKDNNSGFSATQSAVEFFSTPDAFSGGRANPSFIRVKYDFSGQALTRASLEGVDALGDGATAEPKPLSDSIKEFSLKYAGPPVAGSTQPYEWQDLWPKPDDEEQKKSLPKAVRVTLAVFQKDIRGNNTQEAVKFEKVVSLE